MKQTTLQNIVLVTLLAAFGLWASFLLGPQMIQGQLYNETYLVNTTVNITNAAPEIRAIALDTPINLRSYNTTQVNCNISIFDYDNDTVNVNATLYIDGVSQPSDADDGNNHYTNTTCSQVTPQGLNMNFTCTFDVQYYADNSSNWQCNATVIDAGSVSQSNESNLATIEPLVAIKMDPLLDYGDLAVGDVSNDTLANVTNAGNRDANIAVEGYANTPGDGLAFDCDYGSIDLSYERYDGSSGVAYPAMNQLTGATTLIPGFTVPQRTSEVSDSISSTYWKVSIPVGAGGICSGKVLFTASDAGT